MRWTYWQILIPAATVCAECVKSMCTDRCRLVRQCYLDMLADLQQKDEKACIEDVEIGTSTMLVYFHALEQYCGSIFKFTTNYYTSESRDLYEVTIKLPKEDETEINPDKNPDKKPEKDHDPVILIDAGQRAGKEGVTLALTFIERLMACQENEHMIQNVRWIFLPCVNPDGFEYMRFDRPSWPKNTRKSDDGTGFGVDISRNFDHHWDDCETNTNGYSFDYPGPMPDSESETQFVRDVILHNKENLKAYISLRSNGHAILYPHAYGPKTVDASAHVEQVAELISLKVNQRGSSFQSFLNNSIFRMNGKPQCGSSVDYAHSKDIALAYEMRVGFGKDLDILEQFQRLPKGLESTLRSAYFSGIRELYTIVSSAANKDRTFF